VEAGFVTQDRIGAPFKKLGRTSCWLPYSFDLPNKYALTLNRRRSSTGLEENGVDTPTVCRVNDPIANVFAKFATLMNERAAIICSIQPGPNGRRER
jgi:hypothetical protein